MVILRAQVGYVEEDLRNCTSPNYERSIPPGSPSATVGGNGLQPLEATCWSISTKRDGLL